MEYHLPFPVGLAALCTIAPVLNLLVQPVGHVWLRKYAEDYCGNAVNVLHVRSPMLELNALEEFVWGC